MDYVYDEIQIFRESYFRNCMYNSEFVDLLQNEREGILELFLNLTSEQILKQYKTHQIAILTCIEIWKENNNK